MIKSWIEAMRLRTLPVSIAGVITATGFALTQPGFDLLPALLCLLFAILAQIASNFANEYYDFRDGLDRAGREGPRRGVTEGDITPGAMKRATYLTLLLACITGLSLIHWGGWWLLPAGILIAIGAIAYSAGPYPLSRHGLGEVAVIFFFGIIPVNLTYYILTGAFTTPVLLGSVTIGLMGANVLLVNNYRDANDDAAVGKNTLAVIFGRRTAITIYLINGVIAATLMIAAIPMPVTIVYLIAHGTLWNFMRTHRGAALNPILGMTAMLMLLYAVAFAVTAS
ncbi:1,4-dihydroxy-2-naphthoate octaprenyltransferase [Barnesiella sp. WM24]|uniref:1,4-dihydroxy-2-naphthoate octaprenyltransferase n=1 Tax=Barnesiella sp. WM24 TaxID=2558278 RepID=UPI001072B592|nr:1,4-dihydroxy-2-naphthoate octaprenyltransferase [Barnesiella sp. WM24]TFU92224.1 1,4-dihydroxy-2-naphthoate octaprenyltransferase [Barnesiella sp. WM24]